MTRPDLNPFWSDMSDDALRDYVLALQAYVATFTSDGPEPRRASAALDSARSILRDRLASRARRAR
jgi:hypothetical protein